MKNTKRNFLVFLIIAAFITCSVGMTWATAITNTAGDGFEDYANGSVFGYYQNSGELMFTESGNNNGQTFNKGVLEAQIEEWGGYDPATFILVDTTYAVTWTQYNETSGTYDVDTSEFSGGINFYAVKAGNGYAMYLEEPPEISGSWSTYDCWAAGFNQGQDLNISHFTGYNGGNGTSVPDASITLLLGSSLIGLLGFSRKSKKTG